MVFSIAEHDLIGSHVIITVSHRYESFGQFFSDKWVEPCVYQ